MTIAPGTTPASSSIYDEVVRALAADDDLGLQGFITRDDAGALSTARALDEDSAPSSAIRGWTVAVKDNIHTAGLPNSAGTPSLLSFVPDADSAIVAALRTAGAVVLGKANMHELAFGVSSNNGTFGAVRNPLDNERTAGGSSGGSASLVAGGIARFALGTDTGGSVRVPASFTGVCGLRPTTGRYQTTAVTPLSRSRDTVGVIATTVADLIAVDQVITGDTVAPEAQLADLRLGLPTSYFLDPLSPDVEAAWKNAVTILERNGAILVPIDLSAVVALDAAWAMPIVFAEVLQELPAYLERFSPSVTLDILMDQIGSADVAAGLGERRFADDAERDAVREKADQARQRARAEYARALAGAGVDAIVFPTTPVTAPRLGTDDALLEFDGRTVGTFETVIRNTSPGSFAGLPGVTLPIPVSSGLPVGFALDGAEGSDQKVLALANAIEAAFAKAG